MSYQPFSEKRARVTVSVTRNNTRGEPTTFNYVWEQNRMHIVVRQGGKQFGNAEIAVFGVPLEDMNQIARLWLETMTPQNTDTLLIETWNGMNFVPFFQGVIAWSAVDASAMPQVRLIINANAAMALSNLAASPYANAGPVLLQDVLTSLAALGGFTVAYAETAPKYQCADVRLTGSPLEQVGQIMSCFPDLTWFVNLQQIVVREANAPYTTDAISVSVTTGMQNPPVYSSSGLTLTTMFNPLIRPGVALDVQTVFDFVNRTVWVAGVLAHTLDVNVPGGQWTTAVAANSYGQKGNGQ